MAYDDASLKKQSRSSRYALRSVAARARADGNRLPDVGRQVRVLGAFALLPLRADADTVERQRS